MNDPRLLTDEELDRAQRELDVPGGGEGLFGCDWSNGVGRLCVTHEASLAAACEDPLRRLVAELRRLRVENARLLASLQNRSE